jgi:glucan phosphoethanolaminetransferase (alkaline phosphatase superfamily)
MVNWIMIVFVVLIAFIVLKIFRVRHKLGIFLILLFALFIYASFSIVNTDNSFDFSSASGIFNTGKLYLGWLGNGFQNLKTITGQASKLDWTPSNYSFSEKSKLES